MKFKGIKILVAAMLITLLGGTTAFAARCVVKKTEPYFTLEQDVYYPANMEKNKKYPVVFIAHNGYADKADWGDFPQEIANEGFFTVNIAWKSWDTSQIECAISYTLEKYADNIDTENVVFLGSCHGGKEMLEILNKENKPYTVKTAILLSVSEIDDAVKNSQKKGHIPMLVYYSLNDEYGEGVGIPSKQFAEEIVTKPCKVVSQKDPAHGNNMVTKSKTKDAVRKDIIAWAKKYAK